MARAFRLRRVGPRGYKEARFTARLEQEERDLVVGLLHQVAELIDVPVDAPVSHPGEDVDPFDDIVSRLRMSTGGDDEAGGAGTRGERPSHVSGEEDPAIRRLFPIANRTDDEAAAEFARLSEAGLRQRKRDNLLAAVELLERGDSIELTPPQAHTLLVALTDIRVVLGERMGLRTDEDAAALDGTAAALGEDDPRLHFILVYDFLTWLQETLATALLQTVPEEGTRED